MKSLILIAVRMKSTRLPKKALAIIEGQTVIEHLIDRMKECKVPEEVILCTSTHPDDEVLIKYAEKKGIKWFRGSEDDVLDRFIRAADMEGADIVVRVTGDNPLTDPEYIDRMIKHHIETNAEYTYTKGLIQGTRAEVISVAAMKRCHALAENPNYTEYMTLYLRNPEVFKVEWIQADESVSRDFRLTIDTPEDLELMRKIFRELYKPGKIFPLKKVVDFLDENPELVDINKNIKVKKLGPEINVSLKNAKK